MQHNSWDVVTLNFVVGFTAVQSQFVLLVDWMRSRNKRTNATSLYFFSVLVPFAYLQPEPSTRIFDYKWIRKQNVLNNMQNNSRKPHKVTELAKFHRTEFELISFDISEYSRTKEREENGDIDLPRNFRSSASCRSIESLHSRSRKTSILSSAARIKKNLKNTKTID